METQSKRVALVTGANKGLGFETARGIGRTGVIVLLGARNKAAGENAAATLTAEGIDARFLAIDVADYASVEGAASTITSGFGRLDILVNNAGINDPSGGAVPIARLDAVERVLRTNFLGVLAVTQAINREPSVSLRSQGPKDQRRGWGQFTMSLLAGDQQLA